MMFKLFLWSALVFFEHGSEMQLVTALVVNVIQLIFQTHFHPFGGQEARLLNILQFATLALTCLINLGGLALNYLKVSSEAYPDHKDSYDVQTAAIQ